MKIDKLVIYGFGKHEDVSIELGPTINVIYGHNEAGKTTIQQFILHILFGFPPRNSQLLRYEPKSGGKYGGQAHLFDALYGKCIVERVRGKSAGDVKVYFENGEQGDEAALQKLVRHYDRASFESIFSFSMLQLQDFEKMDEQQLSRTLLASGTTGMDHYLQIETKMEKEMEQLFKRNGRNPALNQKLKQLRDLEQQLREQQNKMDIYAPTIQRIKEIEEALQILRNQNEFLSEEIGAITTKRQLYPLFIKKNALEQRLTVISSNTFPVDGIQRYESIHNQLADAKATMRTLQNELEQIENALAERVEGEKLAGLERLIAKESKWHLTLSSIAAQNEKTMQLFEQKERLRARLGVQTDEQLSNLQASNASIQKEEEMYHLLEKLKTYAQEIKLIEKERIKLTDELDRMKEKDGFLNPPSKQRIELAQNWPKIRQQLVEAKAYVSIHRKQQQQSKMIGMILFALTLFLLVYGILGEQFGILLIGGIISAIAFFFLKRQMKDEKVEEMEKMLATYGENTEEMEVVVSQVQAFEDENARHQEEKVNLEMDMRHLHESYDKLVHIRQQAEERLQSFLRQYGFHHLPSINLIPELFRMIREVQEITRQLTQVQQESENLEKSLQNHVAEAEQFIKRTPPRESLYEWIRNDYHLLLQAVEHEKRQQMRKTELMQQVEEKAALIQLLTEKIQTLFAEADVDTEKLYYEAYAIWQEKNSLQEQVNHLNMQLAVHGELEIDLSQTDLLLKNKLDEMKDKIADTNEKQTVLMEEKARLETETNALLTDETYSKLQQAFEVERAQFIELAKKWATQKAIAEAIGQMMKSLKEEKFPSVLQKASNRFAKMTSGRYKDIIITDEGYFEVVSKEGIHTPIVELSQATKEQAYLSFRLALAASMTETAPFPIIMDDPFVHFDETRLSHIIEVLDQSTEHQWIYFTCHKEMIHRFTGATTINVSEIGSK